jgi:ATP-binding cassette, subfamily B, bacterial
MRAHPAARALRATVVMPWRAHRGAFAAQILVMVAAGLAPVAAAWLLRSVLDSLTGGGPHASLLSLVVALAAASGLQGVLPSFGQYLAAQSGRAIERVATTELFGAVGRLAGLRRLEDPAFLDRLNMAQRVSTSAPGQVFTSISGVVQSTLTVIGFLAALLVLNPVMAVVVLAATVPGLAAETGVARRHAAMLEGISHAERRQYFYANLLSSLAAAKEIRLFGLGMFFRRRMLDELRVIQRAGQRVDRRQAAVYSLLAALSAVVAGAGIWWAVSSAARGKLTVGDVSIFVAALGAAGSSLTMIVNQAGMAYQSVLTFRSYTDIVAEGPDLAPPADLAPARALRRGIEFDNVWFRYAPDLPWILRGVSFFVPYGQAVALVGRNGAGKTTLVKLMCRFYDPDRGRILWDGADLRDMDVAGLRDRISAVFQDYMAYELSARENIAVGDLSLRQEPDALAAAARLAGIHDTLTALPNGYDTLLTRIYADLADKEDPRTGVLLSGGQWQRVALARAFLRGGRDLVILDEPSSGLDAEAEYEIHSGLRAHRDGRTSVLISHRLNAVRDADHIVVMVDGAVAEQGDHHALMARGGTYARLFSLQAKGFADDTAPAPAMSVAAEGRGSE